VLHVPFPLPSIHSPFNVNIIIVFIVCKMTTPIIDSHQHFWDLDNLKYEWLKGPNQLSVHLAGDLAPIRENYFVKEYLEDAKNQHVLKSVHLQAECADGLGEVKWLQSVANLQGDQNNIK
jgi:predicted TIM-barrel fold metal-dependent hydrolase